MERFVIGDIVVISFPYSDLSLTKNRPVLVLSDLKDDDIIVCQITSKFKKDNYSVYLENEDLEFGKLKVESVIDQIEFLHCIKVKLIIGLEK